MGTTINAYVGYGLKLPTDEIEELVAPHGGADELFIDVGANPKMEVLWLEGRPESFVGYILSEAYADEGQSIDKFDLTPTIVSETIDTMDALGLGGKPLGLHLVINWL